MIETRLEDDGIEVYRFLILTSSCPLGSTVPIGVLAENNT